MRFPMIPSFTFFLLGQLAPAQGCVPLVGTGQPGYLANPPCAGTVPPAVLAATGAPLFEVGAWAPMPLMVGHTMWIAIGFTAPLFPIPAPPLYPPYGAGLVGVVFPLLLFAPAGPAPGPIYVPFPLPAMPPAGPILTAHTVVLLGPSIAVSEGTGIII
jgi:hypothetical protein